jgi:hypothetical protein
MFLIDKAKQPVNGEESSHTNQLWGAKAIGRVINRTERQTNHLLAKGAIKSAHKVLGQWTANADRLVREFAGE